MSEIAGVGLVGLDDGVQHAGVAPPDAESAPAERPARQTAGKRQPGPSAVGALVETAAGAGLGGGIAAGEAVAADLPGGDVEGFGVRGVKRHVDGARILADVEDAAPGLAAIDGFEQAAVATWTPHMAERSHVGGVRIAGVDEDPADMAGVAQPAIQPGFAAIG